MPELLFSGTATGDDGADGIPGVTRGASVEELWRMYLAFGINAVCVVCGEQPAVTTAAIEHVYHMSRPDALATAGTILAANRRGDQTAILTMYFDGTIGHTISLWDWDESSRSFIFHDSWPGDSLLSAAQNRAGLTAREVADRTWSIPADQLEQVVVALLVLPQAWANATGLPGAVQYDEVRASDFWTWFGVQEVYRDGRAIALRLPAHADHTRLSIEVDSRDRVVKAVLQIARRYIGEFPGLLLSMDIVKSALVPFAPVADQPWLAEAATMLYKLALAVLQDGGQAAIDAAFVGSERAAHAANRVGYILLQSSDRRAFIPLATGFILVETVTENEEWFSLTVQML